MPSAYDLTDIASVKEAILLPNSDVDLDTLLPDLITQASKLIMDYCQRQFAPVETNVTKRFAVEGYHVNFKPWDLQSATTVTLHPETTQPMVLTTDDYQLKPVNPFRGVYTGLQFSGFLVIISMTLMKFNYALVDVQGDWGFSSVPDEVKRACNLTVASWVTRTAPGASAPYGIPAGVGAGAITHRNDWHIPFAAKKILGEFKRGSSRWATT